MKRKLINQEYFDTMTSKSVSNAERELVEASSIVAKALGKDHVSLHCFTESTVVYETQDKTYVHAGYEIKDKNVTFTGIEEMVIDETTRKEKVRGLISQMIEAVVTDNDSKAKKFFNDYLGMVRWTEAKKEVEKKFKDKKDDEEGKGKKKKGLPPAFVKKAGKDIAEAYETARNVLDYVEFMSVGPALAESVAKKDDKGNITDLRIPTVQERNESRINRFDWKTLNAKVADSRKKIPYFAENQNFVKAVAHLKKQNAFSDANGLEEAVNSVVKNWPEVLHATQTELASVFAECLNVAGDHSYDDQTVDFMAEGVLRTAHSVYSERVNQILHLASAPKMEANVDAYEFFQGIVESFYPTLDEKFGLERKVFSDLYDALTSVYKKAERQGDRSVTSEAGSYVNEMAAILNNEIKPTLEAAEEAATWLSTIIETNLEMGKWVVSNSPHMTVNGDHPDMAKKAGVGYTPSKDFSGNWGDEAPAIGQDSMNYKSGKHAKTMRNDSWGQAGEKGSVFPGLKNPYLLKPFGDYTMKGEKGVDKNATGQHHSTWQSSDTWPALKNPFVPKEAGGPGGKGYKMKNGKDTDLVVDK